MNRLQNKLIIAADSHVLSDYQHCSEKYWLSNIENLEKYERKTAFDKGTIIHSGLQSYYLARKWRNGDHDLGLRLALKRIQRLRETFKDTVSQDDILLIAQRLIMYFEYYRYDSVKPVGLETGFSKILYEDAERIFVYEGRMDFIEDYTDKRTGKRFLRPWDHKSRSRNEDIFPTNNQFLGYCWATGSTQVVINYIGLQKTLPIEELFIREVISFNPDLIEDWRLQTIQWFHRIADSLENDVHFKCRASCTGKYSVCDYAKLCDQTNPAIIKDMKRRLYIVRPRKWLAWE